MDNLVISEVIMNPSPMKVLEEKHVPFDHNWMTPIDYVALIYKNKT